MVSHYIKDSVSQYEHTKLMLSFDLVLFLFQSTHGHISTMLDFLIALVLKLD